MGLLENLSTLFQILHIEGPRYHKKPNNCMWYADATYWHECREWQHGTLCETCQRFKPSTEYQKELDND